MKWPVFTGRCLCTLLIACAEVSILHTQEIYPNPDWSYVPERMGTFNARIKCNIEDKCKAGSVYCEFYRDYDARIDDSSKLQTRGEVFTTN